MSLTTPTTSALSGTILSQIQASIGQSVPFLPKAFINVLAKVLAGTIIIIWKYCGSIFLNLFVAYASDQPTTINGQIIVPLTEWGRLIGVGDPLPSTQSQLSISVTVTLQTGTLSAGQQMVNATTGVIYLVAFDVALNAPTVTATIQAVSDQTGGDGSGAIGNMSPGDVISFANPLPNVQSAATVIAQLITGADAELTPTYRARIVARFQAKPQGGAYADYRSWAEDAPGIINVYPYTSQFPGEVDVYCEADPLSSGSPDGIPTPTQLAAALTAIEQPDPTTGLATRRPAGAFINTLPIKRTGFDVTVLSLVTPNTSSTQASIALGLDQYLRAFEPFIAGLSSLPRKDRITAAGVAGVVETIVSADGGTIASVQLFENGLPVTLRELGRGERAKLGSPPVFP